MIRLSTMRSQIRTVADRWRSQYHLSEHDWAHKNQKALDAIDKETATRRNIEKIIGNNAWVVPKTCNGCGGKFAVTIAIDDDDYHTMHICQECIGQAAEMINLP